MFLSLHTSSSVVHAKSTVIVQIINSFLQCHSVVKNTFKNFYLAVSIATKKLNKAIKTFYINC